MVARIGAKQGRGTDELAPEGKKQAAAPAGTTPQSRPDTALGDASVGQALRSAYQRTVNEDVPTDLLDLLGKLD